MLNQPPGLKSQNCFIHNIHLICQLILKFCTEHSSITVMLCAKLQDDWATEQLYNRLSDDVTGLCFLKEKKYCFQSLFQLWL